MVPIASDLPPHAADASRAAPIPRPGLEPPVDRRLPLPPASHQTSLLPAEATCSRAAPVHREPIPWPRKSSRASPCLAGACQVVWRLSGVRSGLEGGGRGEHGRDGGRRGAEFVLDSRGTIAVSGSSSPSISMLRARPGTRLSQRIGRAADRSLARCPCAERTEALCTPKVALSPAPQVQARGIGLFCHQASRPFSEHHRAVPRAGQSETAVRA